MKKIILTLLLTTAFISCKAQTFPLIEDYGKNPAGSYAKDINNDLDNFEGTWVYQNGSEIFTLILVKKEYRTNPSVNYYYDILIGEYKYEINGDVKVNSLPNVLDNSIGDYSHNLVGNMLLLKNNPPRCNDCSENEHRIELNFKEPSRSYANSFLVLRHRVIDGIEQLEARLFSRTYAIPGDLEDSPTVPFDVYTFIKQ